jgi:hypothetical protein
MQVFGAGGVGGVGGLGGVGVGVGASLLPQPMAKSIVINNNIFERWVFISGVVIEVLLFAFLHHHLH